MIGANGTFLFCWCWKTLIVAYRMWTAHIVVHELAVPFTQVIDSVCFDTSSGFGSSELRDPYDNHVLDIFVVFFCLRVAKAMMKAAGVPQTYENKKKYTRLALEHFDFASGFRRSEHAVEYLVSKIEAALADFRREKIKSTTSVYRPGSTASSADKSVATLLLAMCGENLSMPCAISASGSGNTEDDEPVSVDAVYDETEFVDNSFGTCSMQEASDVFDWGGPDDSGLEWSSPSTRAGTPQQEYLDGGGILGPRPAIAYNQHRRRVRPRLDDV